MNKENNKIEEMLSKISFRKLSAEEQDFVWQGIVAKKTPLLLILNSKKIMFTSLIITLMLVLGVGGTVVTADNARPGDTLFEVDQAVENLRLRLASDEKKNDLRIKFADERVKEIKDIEEKDENKSNDNSIKLTVENQNRVSIGINAALELLNGVSASLDDESAAELKVIIDQLNDYIDDLPDEDSLSITVKENKNKTRIDLRSEDGRVRVEIKNGDVRIKQDDSSENKDLQDEDSNDDGAKDDDESNDNDRDDDQPKSDSPTRIVLKIKASVFVNETVVTLEINDRKSSFTTSAKTRAEIVEAIKEKYPDLTNEQIKVVLDIDSKDRSSLIEDLKNVLNDDSRDDEKDDN